MFDVFLDYMKRLLKSRLFPISVIYIALFSVVIYQLFTLQIVQGPVIAKEAEVKKVKVREVKSTRGNIYDRNGILLASNELSFSVVMEDITVSDAEYNKVVFNLINIIEENGDTLDNEFYIALNDNGEFEYTVDGAALVRFKKNAYAYVLEDDKFKDVYQNATAEEVFLFLRNGTGDNYTNMFGISDEYSVEDALKIMSVRYALFCNFPKYLQITVASKVSKNTVAAVMENNAELLGVEIQKQTSRVYEESVYFAHIMGYTGLISAEELDEHEEFGYNSTDVIGKTGLEEEYEEYLAGTKGSETVSVYESTGKVIKVMENTDPIAGNDIYLTIDSELQKNVYHLLEREIAHILLENLVRTMNYGSKGESASEITIPIYEVYNALINNNIIDINQFDDTDASELEIETYQKYVTALSDILDRYDELLAMGSTVTNADSDDMENFLDYFYEVLVDNEILMKQNIPDDDATYLGYKNGNVSLSRLLQYAIGSNWINLSILGVGDEYYSAEELYDKLIEYTKNLLKKDSKFNKMIYRNLVFSYNLSGTEICLLLIDQDVLKCKEDEVNRLENGDLSAYDFMYDKICTLKITPAMLALDPCTGSVVITDVNTGDVLALVTYPSYDNNMLANKVDSKYYAKLLNDNTKPLNNRPLTDAIAPGSTFKMITSFTSLEEGTTNPSENIRDLGEFDKITPAAKCHVYPSTHGSVDMIDAIKVSCNYYFYEMGWRLSIDGAGKYNPDLGLSKLNKYASLFGLNEKSGIELFEKPPQISTKDAIRSSIGQGNNAYTPAQLSRYVTTLANGGTCYNLTLLDKIEDMDGNVVLDNSATVNHDLTNISKSTWDTVLEGMYSVVNVSGGSVFPEFKNFGITVAGKTGTSQVSKVRANNALFVSFAPYTAPVISVTAVIPNGYTSHNAAALCKDIYSLYFELEDAASLIEGIVSGEDEASGSSLE